VPNTGAREPHGGPVSDRRPRCQTPPYRCRSLRRSGCSASARYHVRSPLPL